MNTSLYTRLLHADEDLLQALSAGPAALERFSTMWATLQSDFEKAVQNPGVDDATMEQARVTAANVAILANSFLDLGLTFDSLQSSLTSELHHIFVELNISDTASTDIESLAVSIDDTRLRHKRCTQDSGHLFDTVSLSRVSSEPFPKSYEDEALLKPCPCPKHRTASPLQPNLVCARPAAKRRRSSFVSQHLFLPPLPPDQDLRQAMVSAASSSTTSSPDVTSPAHRRSCLAQETTGSRIDIPPRPRKRRLSSSNTDFSPKRPRSTVLRLRHHVVSDPLPLAITDDVQGRLDTCPKLDFEFPEAVSTTEFDSSTPLDIKISNVFNPTAMKSTSVGEAPTTLQPVQVLDLPIGFDLQGMVQPSDVPEAQLPDDALIDLLDVINTIPINDIADSGSVLGPASVRSGTKESILSALVHPAVQDARSPCDALSLKCDTLSLGYGADDTSVDLSQGIQTATTDVLSLSTTSAEDLSHVLEPRSVWSGPQNSPVLAPVICPPPAERDIGLSSYSPPPSFLESVGALPVTQWDQFWEHFEHLPETDLFSPPPPYSRFMEAGDVSENIFETMVLDNRTFDPTMFSPGVAKVFPSDGRFQIGQAAAGTQANMEHLSPTKAAVCRLECERGTDVP
ncbi:hypothetical protein AcV7_000966 [Taiwanofungus camphoratus]|nr:hypothetical protein AcW2_000553 [Antrodia cinnamomea]KAI0962029.1 hypothetical protein AcV7_000966 [Antrodia cinnamomea]